MNIPAFDTAKSQIQAKKPLTKQQKTAIATTAIVATAATASAVAAFALGKKQAPDAKVLTKLGEGYKVMGKFVVDNATKAVKFVGDKTKAAGEWISKKADDFATTFKKTLTNITSKVGTTAEEAQTLAEDLATM